MINAMFGEENYTGLSQIDQRPLASLVVLTLLAIPSAASAVD